MEQEHHCAFGSFRFDVTQGRLWRGDQRITLRPQSLAMLRYLVEHPGRLVSKAELRQHVWAGTHVTDTVLRVSVHEIREALGDAAAAPRYLETVARQGYRFCLGEAVEGPPPLTPGPLVGRQGDVEALEQWFQRAAQGTRQLVLLSGEAWIGKTTVVDMVLTRLGTPTPEARHPPGRGLFPPGPRRGAPPAGQGVGATRRAEPESAVAATEQARPRPAGTGRGLQLVHRRV